jgi:hypothetical protein
LPLQERTISQLKKILLTPSLRKELLGPLGPLRKDILMLLVGLPLLKEPSLPPAGSLKNRK